jgi:hypothetical protein
MLEWYQHVGEFVVDLLAQRTTLTPNVNPLGLTRALFPYALTTSNDLQYVTTAGARDDLCTPNEKRRSLSPSQIAQNLIN